MSKVNGISSGLGIFRKAAPTQQQNENASFASNPFGISFKGKALSMDAFVSSTAENKLSFRESIQQRGKLFASAVVTNMTNFQNSMRQRFEPIISFGRKTRESISNIWQKMNSYELSMPALPFMNSDKAEVNRLMKLPVSELEGKLNEAIASA